MTTSDNHIASVAIMRHALIASFLANAALALVSLAILPAKVAIHFGPGGVPDNWAPNYANTLIFLGMDIALFCGLYFAPRLALAFPARWTNLPNKQFWLAPENRRRTAAKLAALLHQFGTAIFLLIFVIGLLTIQANLANPVRLKEYYFFPFLILFALYSVAWCMAFFRSFRLPKDTDTAHTAPRSPTPSRRP